jgi:DNA-directed RNA polymerase subunit RPC12/RpoP
MKHDGYRCPCCQGRLATKPRNAKSKRLLNNDIGIKRY